MCVAYVYAVIHYALLFTKSKIINYSVPYIFCERIVKDAVFFLLTLTSWDVGLTEFQMEVYFLSTFEFQ
jgi:hypothetical protein